MIHERRFARNAAMSILQVVVVGGTFFILYRYLLDQIGKDDFGVWAVVLATTSASSIANLGIAGSTIKFVSKHLALNDEARVASIIQTAAISVGAFLAVALLILYPVFRSLLAFLIEPQSKVPAALEILPYAVFSFWLTSVAFVFQSCLDGFHRIDLRSLVLSSASLVYLALSFYMVPRSGLVGLAQAQLGYSALLAFSSWAVLRAVFPKLPIVLLRFDRSSFREMFTYAVNFQVISLTQTFIEPMASALLAKFGGVGSAGIYEMARRLVTQVRALFVTAHQAIVPAIADLQERQPDMIQNIYVHSFRFLLVVVMSALPFAVLATPLVGSIWLGYYDPTFTLFAVLLFSAWFLNMLANPAYFANMGTGHLRWNVIGHLLMAGANAVLGIVLGRMFGATGVVIAVASAVVLGSSVIGFAYHRGHAIPVSSVLDRSSILLGVAALAGMGAGLGLYFGPAESWTLTMTSVALLAVYAAFVAVPIWRHPMRTQVLDWSRSIMRR